VEDESTMKKLIIVPQYPVKMRYQEWWPQLWYKHFLKKYDTHMLGYPLSNAELQSTNIASGDFSPMHPAVAFELKQIKEYLSMDLDEDDILLLCDLSFPGFFSSALFLKPHKNSYAICHATSINNYDLFAPVRDGKWSVEFGQAQMFKKIIVASEYHKRKLDWSNIEVLPFPPPPFYGQKREKVRDIISVARDCEQKRTSLLESVLQIELKSKIRVGEFSTWNDYYKFIAESKVMIITSKEETFGYQILDAVVNNCVPVAPNAFSYSELLPSEYLYRTGDEMCSVVKKVLAGKLKTPKLLNEAGITNFFTSVEALLCT